ncbi:30S ribosomal protein S8 [Candidatus Woesearchaeota archaeon]|nr:30S ribosomal protein S8 [Candidatus Woesearchaeota archaeon]
MMNDTLSNALSKVMNAERSRKEVCEIRPGSGIILKVFGIMSSNGYLGAVSEARDTKGIKTTASLMGSINKCGSIKPRFQVKKDGYERFEKTYLPAKDYGIIIVSTSQGIMTHTDAKSRGLGGKLLAYCY